MSSESEFNVPLTSSTGSIVVVENVLLGVKNPFWLTLHRYKSSPSETKANWHLVSSASGREPLPMAVMAVPSALTRMAASNVWSV